MSTTEEPRSYFSLPYISTGKITVKASTARDGFVSIVFADDLTLWTNSAEFARELVRAGAEALKLLDPPRPVEVVSVPEPEGYPCTRCGATNTPTVDGQCSNHARCAERVAARDAEAAQVHLASCGHPSNEDGECGCSWWPERAPAGSREIDSDQRDSRYQAGAR